MKKYLPSHIALFCCGVLADPAELVADGSGFFWKIGFVSLSPILLGILAEPSTMAEKFMPMNLRIISCATCGTSYGAI